MYTCHATRYTGRGQISYHCIWIPLMGISRKISDMYLMMIQPTIYTAFHFILSSLPHFTRDL
ncbi:hypothetical protein L873DRAFT_766467 [Choiromyces venosus 120613-1]|uniref:Uncharacterized protein n=1 Tax=Choiromyces venosus 120613-1 TaxID=1336337 RepID=A0A3N4JUM3_9PEZI|nr:hypothetical protein L873DRAFT_766467 [Choiromyces venosus 120613-1]